MFNKNFYPTPDNVISKMLSGEQVQNKYILEPNAGKGNIVEYINRLTGGYYKSAKIDCIEIEPELHQLLISKEFNVIDFDFLKFSPEKYYDYIVMNPPFQNAIDHVLHALSIANGAKVISLINTANLSRETTKIRNLKQIIEDLNGTIKDLGSCFVDSERKTKVEVSLIKVQTIRPENPFNFNLKDKEQSINFDFTKNEIARNDNLENIITRYNKVSELLKQKIQIMNEMKHYSQGLFNQTRTLEDVDKKYTGSSATDYNNYMNELKSEIWSKIFSETKVRKYLTSKVQNDFQSKEELIRNYSLTKDNIIAVLDDLFFNRDNIMQQCVVDCFEELTKYFKENRCYVEGWKTNDRWKVNKKIILPYAFSNTRWYDYPNWNYQRLDTIKDLDKALCYISGKDYNSITTMESVFRDKKQFGKWYESEFFDIKGFKKGTIHIKFKEKYLYEQFNITACNGKNWLAK